MKQKNTCLREQADKLQIQRGKDTLLEVAPTLTYLSDALALVGNTARLQILFLIDKEQKLCVCDLSDMLGMTISAVSQHLRKLKDRDFLETERQGQTIFYSLTPTHAPILMPIFQLIAQTKHENSK